MLIVARVVQGVGSAFMMPATLSIITATFLPKERVLMPNLWIRGVTEAAEDAEIRKAVRRHVREVHRFVAGLIRRAQAAGGVQADRDADAEAWIFLAGGFLVSFADRLGGVLSPADFAAQRHRWRSTEG